MRGGHNVKRTHAVPSIFIDRQCEVLALLESHVTGVFDRFDELEIEPGAVYAIGRLEMARCTEQIRRMANQNLCKIIFSNPAEGSESMLDQFDRLRIRDLVFDRKIAVLGGGDIESGLLHHRHENFLFLTSITPPNPSHTAHIDKIFSNKSKPFDFLFLNGRLRSHRKWLIEFFRHHGLLSRALWSCLHANHGGRRHQLKFMIGGKNLMYEAESLRLLPKHYELEDVHSRYDAVQTAHFAKPTLFGTDVWLDGVINPCCYVDSYFSVVAETVFSYPYSFRTEKIWKPIMIGHPWIAAANRGYYRDLRKMGFKTFYPLIDESFDLIDHDQDRIEAVANAVNDLCRQDLVSFLDAAHAVCKYNQQHFLELARDTGNNFAENFLNFANHLVK